MTQKEVIEKIASLRNEDQTAFYNALGKNGLTEKEIDAIKNMVFIYKIYNDKTLYDVTVEAIGKKIYAEANA